MLFYKKRQKLFCFLNLIKLLFIVLFTYTVLSDAIQHISFSQIENQQDNITYSQYANKDTGNISNKNKRQIKSNYAIFSAKEKQASAQHVKTATTTTSAPWSNAFNFKKVWGTTVDLRTGILNTWVKTGSMLSNLGHGPDINLNVNYSSTALANPDGLGTGWSWNLTHFNPITHQLTTSFGQNFYLKKLVSHHWQPLYHKLHDIFIQGDISTHFVITYANGLRETLNHEGYETRLEQQDGSSVYFDYISGTHLLKSIKDDQGHTIKLHRTNNAIKVISQGNNGQPICLLIHKTNNEIHSITLPSFNEDTNRGIYFHYIQHFMTGVDYPTGLKSRINYNCSNEIKMPVNNSLLVHALCAVVKETTDPGFGQPLMISRYRYGKTNLNEHNYLGFNAGLKITIASPKDRLFEAPVSYTYQTEEDNGLIREIRTYNKYHLMTDEQQVSDRTGRILSSVHYFFCRTDQYDGCAHNSFTDLPAAYSQPLKIVTRVWGDTTDKPAITTVTARYDAQGRITRQTDVYGRVTINHYCPLNGDAACPPASAAWPFATLTESATLYPAYNKAGTDPLPPVTTQNYYRKEINYNGKGYIGVLDHQTEISGNQQLTTTRYYYNNPDDLLTYGLLKQTVLTGRQNETDSADTLIKNYYYVKSPDSYTKTIYSSVEISKNKRLFSSYLTISLFTNQMLMVTDAEKKDSDRYYYDQWDRLIKTTRAVGTDFAASIHYSYTMSKNINQVLITAVNGLQKKIIFDSAGRMLTNFTEAIDKTGKQQPGIWWPVQKNHYDQYGRVTRQSHYTFKKSGQLTTLDTTQDYDDTGRVIRVHFPDGRITVMQYEDSDRCVISYQQNRQSERSIISVSRANILSEPVKQWILPATNTPLPSVKSLCLHSDKQPKARVSAITYDGFGRQITVEDPAGRIVRQHYDSLGRLTDSIDPAGNRMHSVYNLAGQTVQSWIYPVSGGHYLLSSAGYNRAGQLIWHAGEDGKRTVYTYTADGQIATTTTPNQHIFFWQYNLLNLPISQSTDNKQQWIFSYNPVTLNVTRKTDVTGTTMYCYSDDGLTKQLTFNGRNNYPDYKLQWAYDNNRRIINTKDIDSNTTGTQYDWLGRISRITYHSHKNHHTEILSAPVYDNFSRIQYIDYGSGMHRTLHYDSWGHTDQATDTQQKQLISQWKITYGISDNIIRISQTTEQKQFGILYYKYDLLDNLVSMQCKGSSGLPLCPHDTALASSKLTQAPVIIRQDYTFTPLNRIASVQEILQPVPQQTVSKVIRYRYNNSSLPLRLQSINTTWNQNEPVTQNFTYDTAGNMTADGQNNHITYNALNEVTRVISSTGKQSDYHYDGSGQEVMEKSPQGISYLFYCGSTLINEKIISPKQDTHTIGYLGVAKTTDGIISEYYENSYKGDMSGIFRKNNNNQYQIKQRNTYSPYGMVWHKASAVHPLYQQTLQGFDGERTDPATGWQFLGAGNRTYNPNGRYFLSEDPAGDGYAFGSNNPIINTDPSGNSPKWLGEIFKWTGYISTMGLSALHQRWANITAAVIQAGCTVATMGAAAASAGSAALTGVVAGTATIGSIPVIAAAMPANKGFNIAGKIIGMAEMVTTVAAGAIDLISFAMENNLIIHTPCRMLSVRRSTSEALTLLVREGTPAEETSRNFFAGISEQQFTEDHLIPQLYDPASLTVSETLKYLPCHYEHEGQGYLNLDSLNKASEVWLELRKWFKNNVECDTASILMSYHHTGLSLPVAKLVHFLSVREMNPWWIGKISPGTPYAAALIQILSPLKNIRTSYHIKSYDFHFLSSMLSTSNDRYFLISSSKHMAVMRRSKTLHLNKGRWFIYNCYENDGIKQEIIDSPRLQRLFFTPFDKKFTSYMRIG